MMQEAPFPPPTQLQPHFPPPVSFVPHHSAPSAPPHHPSPPLMTHHPSPPLMSHQSPPSRIPHQSPPIMTHTPPHPPHSSPQRPESCMYQSWFPPDPDCPNHRTGVPYSSAYGGLTAEGQARCPECFLHSTITQSVNMTSSHPDMTSSYAEQFPPNNHPTHAMFASEGMVFRDGTTYGVKPEVRHHVYNDVTRIDHPHPAIDDVTAHRSDYVTHSMMMTSGHVYDLRHTTNSHVPSDVITFRPLHTKRRSDEEAIHESSRDVKGASDWSKPSRRSNKPEPPSHNRKRKADDLCQVCGDVASGYHYNALTCEGCKGFFRRSISRKELFHKCKNGGYCQMDTYTRRKCPECRMKKCKQVGMLEECLLTEVQCRSKRKSKTAKKSEEIDQTSVLAEERSQEEENLIGFVEKSFTDYREHPAIVKGWRHYLEKEYGQSEKPTLSEILTVHVQILVAFIKKLPGFIQLTADDQIALVKGSVVPVMLLRNSCGYNSRRVKVDVSHLVNNGGIEESYVSTLLDFFHRMREIGLDDTEYGLLIAIIIFDSDHRHVQGKREVDAERDKYLSALQRYARRRRPRKRHLLARILDVVTQLRSLCHTHCGVVTSWRRTNQLTPLLYEIWDER